RSIRAGITRRGKDSLDHRRREVRDWCRGTEEDLEVTFGAVNGGRPRDGGHVRRRGPVERVPEPNEVDIGAILRRSLRRWPEREQLVLVVLFQVGQQAYERADQLGVVAREVAISRVVAVSGQGDLLEVVGALDACGGLADLLDRRQEQPDEDGNDGDDHQQLDQRERGPPDVVDHGSLRPNEQPDREKTQSGSTLYGPHRGQPGLRRRRATRVLRVISAIAR